MQKMKFRLNIPAKKAANATINRHTTFESRRVFGQDEGDEEEEEEQEQDTAGDKKKAKGHRANVNQQLLQSSVMSKKIAEQHAKALEEDANIFDYDAVYDDLKEAERLKREALKGPESTKPKYIKGLLEMAEIRKRDRLLAEEKKIAREREAEGDQFADKEVFMTEAYKKQKAELERIEAEERKREEEANKKKTMTSFYKQLLEKKEAERTAIMEQLKKRKEAKANGEEVRSENTVKEIGDVELALQAKREGKEVILNDNNEIVDRRQLLGAGLNVRPKFGSLGSLSDERARERQREYEEYKRKKVEEYEAKRRGGLDKEERERYSREIERQLMETRRREQEEEERKRKELEQKATAKRTTEEAAMSARERYLARKKQKLEEEAKQASSSTAS